MNKLIASFLLFAVLFCGCKKDDVDQAEVDRQLIEDYLEENNIDAESLSSGLYYVIDDIGTGTAFPDINSEITASYTGYFLDGTEFETSPPGQPIIFPLSGVIAGWQQGIPLFKKNGKGTLYIPSALGYGDQDNNDIPANSVLIFDINVIDF